MIEAEQIEHGNTGRNDRLLAVAAKSVTHRSLQELADINDDLLAQIEHFFVPYNAAKGTTFAPRARAGRERARQLVEAGIERAR